MALIGCSAWSKASSVIDRSVMRTGTTRSPHTSRVSGVWGGTISSRPPRASAALAITSADFGNSSISSDASAGSMPCWTALGSACSNWSAASSSTAIVMVSPGGPLRRCCSPGLRPPGVVLGVRRRVTASGLYWNTMMLASGLTGSKPTIAPLATAR